MDFFLSWIVSAAFIGLTGIVAYPIIRLSLRAKRGLTARWWRKTSRKRALVAWRAVAPTLQLDFQSTPQLSLQGSVEDLPVNVHSFLHKEEHYTRILVTPSLSPQLEMFFIAYESGHHFVDGLQRCNPSYQPKQMKRYDHNFMALGDEEAIIALLDENTRQAISDLVEPAGTLHVRKGLINFEREGLYESDEVLANAIQQLVQLGRQFDLTPETIPAQLLANYQRDTSASIRIRNVQWLLTHHKHTPEAKRAQAELLDDPMPEVRLFGAMQRGEEGFPQIKELADNPETPQEIRINALKYLAGHIVEEQSMYAVKVMLILLQASEVNQVAIIPIARAIERFGGAIEESTCLELLQWNAHPKVAYAVQAAGARLLAKNGTITAIPPLKECSKSRNKELKKAAEQAILHIQTRLGDVEAGRLSLLEESDHEGALSTTEDIGAVSLIDNLVKLAEDPMFEDD
jgi:hypothetical protein